MTYIKIGETLHPATITSAKAGREWGNREMKVISLEMDHATASTLFVGDVKWSTFFPGVEVTDENGETTTTEPVEYDCSDYCLAGPITDNRDGTIIVRMGKLTDSELLAIMMGGN